MIESRPHDLRIEVRPSPKPGGSEVLFFADGVNIIDRYWDGMIGLAAEDLLLNPCPIHAHDDARDATIARCECGFADCDSFEVRVVRSAGEVEWHWVREGRVNVLRFRAASYDDEVVRAMNDKTWMADS